MGGWVLGPTFATHRSETMTGSFCPWSPCLFLAGVGKNLRAIELPDIPDQTESHVLVFAWLSQTCPLRPGILKNIKSP